MKEKKNRTLLIGIMCQAAVIVLLLVKLMVQLINDESKNGILLLLFGEILPIVILFAALLFPIILLSRNRKNQPGEILPLLSIAANGLVFVWTVASLFMTTYPQYLLLGELGLTKVYLSVVLEFFKNGGLLFIVGIGFVILGSLFSFPAKKSKEKSGENRQ